MVGDLAALEDHTVGEDSCSGEGKARQPSSNGKKSEDGVGELIG